MHTFAGLCFDKDPLKKIHLNSGSSPSIEGKLTAVLDTYKNVNVTGEITGYVQDHTVQMGITDSVRISFYKDPQDAEVVFKTNILPEDYIRFTDLATIIRDCDGKHVSSTGMDYPVDSITLDAEEEPGKYELVFIFAYTFYNDLEEFEFPLEEIHYLPTPIKGKGSIAGGTVYQGIEYDYKIELESRPEILPEGFEFYSKIEVKKQDKVVSSQILRLKP